MKNRLCLSCVALAIAWLPTTEAIGLSPNIRTRKQDTIVKAMCRARNQATHVLPRASLSLQGEDIRSLSIVVEGGSVEAPLADVERLEIERPSKSGIAKVRVTFANGDTKKGTLRVRVDGSDIEIRSQATQKTVVLSTCQEVLVSRWDDEPADPATALDKKE